MELAEQSKNEVKEFLSGCIVSPITEDLTKIITEMIDDSVETINKNTNDKVNSIGGRILTQIGDNKEILLDDYDNGIETICNNIENMKKHLLESYAKTSSDGTKIIEKKIGDEEKSILVKLDDVKNAFLDSSDSMLEKITRVNELKSEENKATTIEQINMLKTDNISIREDLEIINKTMNEYSLKYENRITEVDSRTVSGFKEIKELIEKQRRRITILFASLGSINVIGLITILIMLFLK